ncbi:alpha-amylase family glycosyl hydrolase [Gracilinema caldarium]|uniref:Alpha amylase catalytic region n=1 Tax=Gracilinema caldarium (strain ATCC 51460 / DSM 7334 / H1) TaxID=744872 RepID=F8EY52_GRAC1|nr:alpha-amylase family glycosyl hydrolase [Gracilinema caldarium]AEJ20713.1 alpha amylase catalytic region [Gracilinema caldarium DSM 7334]
MTELTITLQAFNKFARLPALKETDTVSEAFYADTFYALREFHVAREVRDAYGLDSTLFAIRGNVIFADFRSVREFAQKINSKINPEISPERYIKAGKLNAMGLIDEILHYVTALYREQACPTVLQTTMDALEQQLGEQAVNKLLTSFVELFPPQSVYEKKRTVAEYLKESDEGTPNRLLVLEELMLLRLANENPAFEPFAFMFSDETLAATTEYSKAVEILKGHLATLPHFGPDNQNLWDLLRSPAVAEPYSLYGQLEYIRKKWGLLIGKYLIRLLTSLDVIKEEEKPSFSGPGPTRAYIYNELEHEYERFSEDREWMPRTVLMAKSTLVWLYQLSQKYNRPIHRLDQIPDEELDELARRGFTGLWLIGLWERSQASREIKRRCGNPEAAASAYSLYDYDIAAELGGWEALENLRHRCSWRGIRLGSDMVPNHTGIDSRWIMEHPDRFLQLQHSPFPSYTFNGENLSNREGIGIYLEDHYYSRSDAAVVFKRVDFRTGDTRYIYHGNDGTSMPWNDTAQIDFLNPEAREAVIQTIIGVCKQFPIVRFDAAMTLAKKHIQRLWYPEPGTGGDIASRAEYGLTKEEFDKRIPNEFWREVVDRCAVEAPDTLLLAEAFWMMEGYFVRTLGMHRVYNSAFMNMLKMEENAKYRATIKNTLEFDPQILQRFVNFMNNPDEETAAIQFGRGDKYFGVCTLMATMPGLPMFGHGQIEGFEEKYGMEYRRSYRNEAPDQELIARHEREIFPLLKKRRLFADSENFALYDLYTPDGSVNENVFAYSNRLGEERALVFYNNNFHRASGWIRNSVPSSQKGPGGAKMSQQKNLAQALGLSNNPNNFTLLREQRSDRWFIRSSRELNEKGLFIALDGYQSQVFLDIHEINDNALGHWQRLHDELAGRGVPDLHAAFQDLFLRDLYSAFKELVKPSYFNGFYQFFTQEQKGLKATPFIEILRDPILRYIRIAREYLDGASGRYESFERKQEYNIIEAEQIWDTFAQSMQRFIKLGEYVEKPPASLQANGKTLIHTMYTKLHENPRISAYIAGYLVLALHRGIIGLEATGEDARRLVDHWCLDRKLRESYQEAGFPADESYHVVELLKLILSRTMSEDPDLFAGPSISLSIASHLFTREDFKSFLNVNLFNDVLWFTKERLEQVLFFTGIIAAIESDEAALPPQKQTVQTRPQRGSVVLVPHPSKLNTGQWTKRLEMIAQIKQELSKAMENSEYKVEELLKALRPKTMVVKPTSGTNTRSSTTQKSKKE